MSGKGRSAAGLAVLAGGAEGEDESEEATGFFEGGDGGRARRFYLCGEIGPSRDYCSMFEALRKARPDDAVEIRINSEGGDIATGLQMIQAMRDCKASVRTVLDPIGQSMAALLFLAGDEPVSPGIGLLMFHNYSSGLSGKGNEQVEQAQAVTGWYARILREVAFPFLSKAEIDKILKGQDFWLQQEEIVARLGGVDARRRKGVRA